MPVSAASSHASPALHNSNGAQAPPTSFAQPPVAKRQPHNGGPNHGQKNTHAVAAAAPKPTAADNERVAARVGTAQHTSVVPNGIDARPANPAADAHGGTLAPQTVQSAAKNTTRTASSADAFKSLPSLKTSASTVNGRGGSDSSRQHGPTGDARGPTTTQSPVGADSAPVSKPILKMKRTGQNFPISSPRSSAPLRTSASWHQRKAPSPNKTTASAPHDGSGSLSKAPDSPQSHGPKLPTAVNGSKLGEKNGSIPSGQTSTKSRKDLTYERFLAESTSKSKARADGLTNLTPISSKTGSSPMESLSNPQPTKSAPRSGKARDASSDDDEIKYETAPKTVFSGDALEAGMEEGTSDDDTESGGDDDDEEALGSLSSPGGDASPRQLFHPPEESDYEDDTEDKNGTWTSSSSSPTDPTFKRTFISIAGRTKTELESKDADAPSRSAVPQKVIHPGNADEMWKYIQPFLIKHRDTMPALNWVRHVIHLPRVRDLKWNEPRTKDRPYHDSHPRDVTALIVYITGVEAPTPCTNCVRGKGPFDGCIMISPQASQESRNHVLACANCYYHCGQSMCSHCSRVVPRRRDRHERLTQKKKIYNLKVLSDKARGAFKAPKISQQQPATGQHSLEEVSQDDVRVYQPSEIHSLEMASGKRAYKVIWGKHGEPISMCGALIPEGYDLDRAVPGRPWVCPIRSCRAVFKKIVGLGSHFSVKHKGCLLNDNQPDGTLSIVGVYNQPLPGLNYCAPLIISQNPLDKNAPPMVASKAPGYVRVGDTNVKAQTQMIEHMALDSVRPVHTTQVNGLEPTSASTHNGAKRIWNYILPFLPPSLDPEIFDAEVVRLFALPLLQSVQWRKGWMKRRLDNDRSQIFAILVHVLGVDRKTTNERPCSLCTRGEGPFEGCWTLPRRAAWESHKFALCCANCLFIHKKTQCSVKYSWEARCDTKPGERTFLGSPPPVSEWAASAANANSGGAQSKKRQLPASDLNEGSLPQRRRYEPNRDTDDEKQAAVTKEHLTLPLHSSRRTTRSSGSPSRHKSPQPQLSHHQSIPTRSSPALIMAGQQTSEELLEMEDWEIAPGRIREEGVNRLNNIAFSKSYLENNQSIPVSADVSFRVDTIKSGHKLEFEANTFKTRYCSVASGKLRVTIAGQPEFVIGPHGMFKIKTGVKAWAQNRLYVDSVVHVVSVEDSG